MIDVGPYLTGEASYTVQVRAAQWKDSELEYVFGDWASITFTYQTKAQEELDGSEDSEQEPVNPFTPGEQSHVTSTPMIYRFLTRLIRNPRKMQEFTGRSTMSLVPWSLTRASWLQLVW